MGAKIIGKEDLPEDIQKDVESLAKKLAKTLVGKLGEDEAKGEACELVARFDGSHELEIKVKGHTADFKHLIIHLLQREPRLIPAVVEAIEYIQHALECNCSNCTAFRGKLEANIEKLNKEEGK